MTLFGIIPVKPFAAGKSRLKSILSDAERYDLNRRMYEHVLSVAISVIGGPKVIVVSSDDAALALAINGGANAVSEEQPTGLNAAIKRGAKKVVSLGGDALLVLPTDLPTISGDDIEAILGLAKQSPSVVIAPDRAESGTNALLISPVDTIPFLFGKGSFALHEQAARATTVEPAIIYREGLAFDIDTTRDYERLTQPGWGPNHP